MRIVLDAAIVSIHDASNGFELTEPAVVAIHRATGLPHCAGWAALGHDEVRWPLEHLDEVHADPEPRRTLLAHLVRTALDRRPWWDRVLNPTVILVVPPSASGPAIDVLRLDARLAGAARNVRIEQQIAGGAPTRQRPTDRSA